MKAHKWFSGFFPVLLYALPDAAMCAETEPRIEDGSIVSIEYTLTADDGTEIDSNANGKPIVYTQGIGELLPAVEQALAGAVAGERRQFTLPPEKAFGEVVQDYVQEIDLDRLPKDARQAGAALVISNDKGQEQMIRVKEIKGDKAVIDFNHPLAGKTLHFDIKVLSIK
jgi:FKBP-type peptidyl-prolyl cis-trans isomerase SlyD